MELNSNYFETNYSESSFQTFINRTLLFIFFSLFYTAAISEFRMLLKSFSLDPGYLLSSGDTTRVNAFFRASACASNSSEYDVNDS
jgi:hypothetical protein